MMKDLIIQRIKDKGPINVADYMSLCLYDPEHGYYMNRDPFGSAGDFTTAPEMTQLFGEMIGIWVIDLWQKLGCPEPFHLVEAGPGRGTLMSDILRTLQKVRSTCYNAAAVHLVEISPHLKSIQMDTLQDHGSVSWTTNIEDIDFDAPVILIGNEVLDAFPVRQFQKTKDGYKERTIGLDGSTLTYQTSDRSYTFHNTDAEFIETYDAMEKFLRSVKRSIKKGAALFIDYGAMSGSADTLQALSKHQTVDVLEKPGESDLTTHVNFGFVADIMGSNTLGPTDMGYFLTQMGLPIRAATLLENTEGAERESLQAAIQRLMHPSQMGSLFKVVCWRTQGVPDPAGFQNTFFQ